MTDEQIKFFVDEEVKSMKNEQKWEAFLELLKNEPEKVKQYLRASSMEIVLRVSTDMNTTVVVSSENDAERIVKLFNSYLKQ